MLVKKINIKKLILIFKSFRGFDKYFFSPKNLFPCMLNLCYSRKEKCFNRGYYHLNESYGVDGWEGN